MFSIRKFLGQDDKFFDLLEASAQQADTSVHELVALLSRVAQEESEQSLDAFVHSRRKDKKITQELTEQLVKTFITPLEREDIQALAAALYKIPEDSGEDRRADPDLPDGSEGPRFYQAGGAARSGRGSGSFDGEGFAHGHESPGHAREE